jgi:plastocyanin
MSTLIALSLLMCSGAASALEIDVQADISTGTETNIWDVNAPATPPRVHHVAVGASGDQRFNPRYINAGIGDFVRFWFEGGNHTVTESTFMDPCSAHGAFDTNFFHAPVRALARNDMTVVVDTTNPRWFFCRQNSNGSHCHSGMVFALNPGPFWFGFVARARNSSSALVGSTVGKPSLPVYTSQSVNLEAARSLSTALTSTVTERSTRTTTVATVTSTADPLAAWSTRTLTTMITTIFSVPQ